MSQSTLIPKKQEAAASEDRSQMVSKIRDTIRSVPPERYDEIFSDFADAIDSGDINILAETVANWAVSLPREKAPGDVVNHALDRLPPLKDDPELYALLHADDSGYKNLQ